MRNRSLLPWAPILLGAAVLAAVWWLGAGVNPGPLGFRLDDAWIHMVYGRELAGNGNLAYNPGIPTTGCTSPLWAVCLAAVHTAAGDDTHSLVRAVLLLGAALHLAAVGSAAALTLRVTGSRGAAAAAGVLVALATPLAAAAFSGMEVTLTGLLLMLAVRDAAGAAWTRSGVFLALAALARPESAVVTVVVAALVPSLAGRASARAAVTGLLAPSVVGGAVVAAHHLWASGSPLPATFHAKSAASVTALPGRVAIALRDLLPGIPPFAAGLGWLALAGMLPWGRRPPELPRAYLPLAAGAAFLLANLFLIDPADPPAFYHLRYVLPAVPLLLVSLAIGAHEAGRRAGGRLPTVALLALAIVGAVRTAAPVSRHLHNDVRNINEVQREIGTWLGENVPPGAWIASSDAGAVRYFSRRPTLDVLGLNTPEMLSPSDAFLREHPVAALVLLPAWFRSPDADRMDVVFHAGTEDYTVTSNPGMARQVVLTAKPDAAVGGGPLRVRFLGYREFAVDLAAP